MNLKYTIGDLIDWSDAGLGYITKLTLERYGIVIHIKWFADQADHVYHDYNIDRWIMNRTANHYPVGKQ